MTRAPCIHTIGRMSGLRSPNLLSQHPKVGAIMAVGGLVVFGILLFSVLTSGPLLQWDTPLSTYLHPWALRGGVIVKIVNDVSFDVGEYGVIALGVILGIYYLYKRFWREFTMVAAGFGGGAILFEVISLAVGRPRPPVQMWTTLTIPGFPSGHAISAITGFGFLAYLLVPRMSSRLSKWAVVVGLTLLVLTIGFCRLLVGGHYLTDIVAGYALGIAWAGIAYTLVEVLFNRARARANRH